ncbi:MAG TPA: lipase maturation factor family protein, partial [Polyangiaceae bacterium]|nr:lipase maturation factor family protein [Polyangiaceae bacterium]
MGALLDARSWPTAIGPELIWGLFVRGLGVLFVISFISLVGQVVTNSGRDGGLPVGLRLRRIEQDFPSARRFYYFPTLLWLNGSDAMLRALAVVGIGAGVLTIYGGPFGYAGLVGCYVCYLSLDTPVGLIFPWDSLLFESTVLALFLPHVRALPNLEALSAPAPALAWAYRILLFRLMFGFGKQKFFGSRNKDLSYLKGFLVAQPLPSPLG